jgi:hypothetical protein
VCRLRRHPSGDVHAWLGQANIGCSTCNYCTKNPVQLDVGPGDTFYETAIDTDGVFYLSGRGSFMDGLLAASGSPRASAPAACP